MKDFDIYLENQGLESQINLVKKEHIYSYLSYLSHSTLDKKAITVVSRARKLSSIKSFFAYLHKQEFIEKNPAIYIDLPTLPQKEPDYLTEYEYRRLLRAIRQNATPFFLKRDLAIFVMFLTTGIRVSELVNLKLKDVNIRSSFIRVTRKRNKQQTIPLNSDCLESLQDYLAKRGSQESSLFLSKRKSGLRSNSIYCLVKKYLNLAGISKSSSGAHLLRHTCFTSLLANGVNPVIIQELAGHTSFDTTRRYLHLNNTQVRDAVNKLNLKKGEL